MRYQKGLTLIEILIGITVSAMLFLVSSSFIASLFFTDARNKHQEILEQVKNDLQSELSTSIRWAKDANISGNTLTLDGVQYRLDGGRIFKGTDPITPKEVTVESMEIKNYSTDSSLVSAEILINIKHKNFNSVYDNMRIVVSQRKTEITE